MLEFFDVKKAKHPFARYEVYMTIKQAVINVCERYESREAKGVLNEHSSLD